MDHARVVGGRNPSEGTYKYIVYTHILVLPMPTPHQCEQSIQRTFALLFSKCFRHDHREFFLNRHLSRHNQQLNSFVSVPEWSCH
jgi:hypothetical protein